jgi:Zn-dependent protease
MRSYTITSVWGIPIRINSSLLIFLPILAWLIGSGGQIEVYAGFIEGLTGVAFDLAQLRAGSMPWVIGIAAAVGLFVSVTLHELGHSWVALRYGVEIESITLWILGGMASLKSVPREWNREFWIAIAGPVTSVLVAGVFWAGLLAIPSGLHVPRFVVGWLALTNVILAGFNLLPAFPMDGGRILRALLARQRPYASATRIAGRVGVVFALLFAVVGVLSFNVILILLALFIYGAATSESRTVLVDELLEGVTVGDIVARNPATVSPDTTLEEFGVRMLRDRQTAYPVVDESGETVGVVSLTDLKGIRRSEHADTRIESVMRSAPSLDSTADAFDSLAELQQAGHANALIREGGSLLGVLSEADYARALSLQREFRGGLG